MPARFALGAAVPAVVILAIVLLTSGGSSRHTPRALPPPAKLPPLVQSFASSAIGASGQLPNGWTAVRGPGFLRLASRDRTSQIALVAQPSVPGKKLPLLRSALASIRKAYGAITVRHGRGTTLGGLPARSVVLYTHNKTGVPIRILVAAAQGRRQAYVLEAFNAQRAPERDLVETQQIVIALRLAG
jgi:hypothetical protein